MKNFTHKAIRLVLDHSNLSTVFHSLDTIGHPIGIDNLTIKHIHHPAHTRIHSIQVKHKLTQPLANLSSQLVTHTYIHTQQLDFLSINLISLYKDATRSN